MRTHRLKRPGQLAPKRWRRGVLAKASESASCLYAHRPQHRGNDVADLAAGRAVDDAGHHVRCRGSELASEIRVDLESQGKPCGKSCRDAGKWRWVMRRCTCESKTIEQGERRCALLLRWAEGDDELPDRQTSGTALGAKGDRKLRPKIGEGGDGGPEIRRQHDLGPVAIAQRNTAGNAEQRPQRRGQCDFDAARPCAGRPDAANAEIHAIAPCALAGDVAAFPKRTVKRAPKPREARRTEPARSANAVVIQHALKPGADDCRAASGVDGVVTPQRSVSPAGCRQQKKEEVVR